MKKILSIVFLVCFFSSPGYTQPAKGFIEVFSNPLLLLRILPHLNFQDIASLRCAVSSNKVLISSEELILNLGLYVIRDIDMRAWRHVFSDNYSIGTRDLEREVRGIPRAGMIRVNQYTEYDVLRVVSYSESVNSLIIFGEFNNGAVFFATKHGAMFFSYKVLELTSAPSWGFLLSNIQSSELKDFISNLNTSTEFKSLLEKNMDCPDVLKNLLDQALRRKN